MELYVIQLKDQVSIARTENNARENKGTYLKSDFLHPSFTYMVQRIILSSCCMFSLRPTEERTRDIEITKFWPSCAIKKPLNFQHSSSQLPVVYMSLLFTPNIVNVHLLINGSLSGVYIKYERKTLTCDIQRRPRGKTSRPLITLQASVDCCCVRDFL